MVSRTLTYALWLFFGLFGLHHLYLRRYRHGLVWLCTVGGFGFGWLRDFFHLGVYIEDATEAEKEAEMEEEEEEEEKRKKVLAEARNGAAAKNDEPAKSTLTNCSGEVRNRTEGKKKEEEEKEEERDDSMSASRIEQSARKKRSKDDKPPKSSWTRSTGQVIFAVILDVTFLSAIPEEMLQSEEVTQAANLAAAFFAAVGLHTVGNIGRHQLSFWWCLFPSIIGHFVFPPGSETSLYGIVIAAIVADWKGRSGKRRRRPKKPRMKPLLVVALAFSIYMSMWISGLWFNTYITTSDGEKVRLKDAVENFFNSPAWKEMLDTMLHLYEYVKHHGFANLYREFIIALDPEGEANAYKVLDLKSDASPQEIKVACRKLSRQYHPDKARGEEAKEVAGQKFIEVQSACQVLDKLRSRRMKNSAASIEL